MANEVNYSEYFPPPPIAGPFRFRLNEWLRSLARQPRQVFGSWEPLNWSEEKYSTASQNQVARTVTWIFFQCGGGLDRLLIRILFKWIVSIIREISVNDVIGACQTR